MCGLFGELRYTGAHPAGVSEDTARRILALAARRGPDDDGLWSDGGHCILGFRRLSILDLSTAAHQPMCSADGRHVLVYNGELYNYRALRAELEGRGVQFRSSGDSEVVLYALATWGHAVLSRFNGMFALGWYDTRERRLVLARDHAGMKPLYYLLGPAGAVFASQYDQLLAHPWSRALQRNDDGAALYLRLGYIPAPYGLLRDTYLLPAGTWLEIDAQRRSRQGRFFEFPHEREPDLRGAEADEAVQAAVTAAVRRHLVADVPVGSLLSGGIDSPLIAATMRAVGEAPVPAFTLSTGGDQFDESNDAAIYAREIGVDHVIGELTADSAFTMLDDVVSACGEPFADYSLFPTLFVSKLARQHVKVVLCGDGGDELFWGYIGRFGALLQMLSAPGRTEPRWTVHRVLDSSGEHADFRWPGSVGDLHRLRHTRGTEGWLRRIFPHLPAWPGDCDLFSFRGREVDPTARWLRWNEFSVHLGALLEKVDRGSMFHSLEARAPLLDREVIDVASRVDWRTCLDPVRQLGKLPLRRALAARVRHQTTSKRGFTVPMAEWLRGCLAPVVEESLLQRNEIIGLAVDRAAVRELFELHRSGRADHHWLLWVLLSLTLWERTHYRAHGHGGNLTQIEVRG
jgi:asparagine synthase (glutamine-hydrolysing)